MIGQYDRRYKKVQQNEEGLTFQKIDKILNGSLSAVIGEAWSIACESGNYFKGYSWGKRFISALVGWESRVYALRNHIAYEIAIHQLADACEDGEMAHEKVGKFFGPHELKLSYERNNGFFWEPSPGEA